MDHKNVTVTCLFRKFTYKSFVLIIIGLFAYETMAICKIVEYFSEDSQTADEQVVEMGIHYSDNDFNENKAVDSCTLCFCCANNSNIIFSTFLFANNFVINAHVNILQVSQKYCLPPDIFRPPKSIS